MDKALETQLANLTVRTGKSLAELHTHLKRSGLAKHGEMVKLLKSDLGMGHGDANTVVHTFLNPPDTGAPKAVTAVLDETYTGAKAPLRPVHEAVLARIHTFGDFEIAPKKGYVSLRRKKQFAMVGPGTKGRLEIGINLRGAPDGVPDGVRGDTRFVAQPPGGMCQFKVHLTTTGEVDAELEAWLRAAYEAAG
ncbi:MAG: DUF5655 domain-containing protein [Candidatus Binatia bacterium]